MLPSDAERPVRRLLHNSLAPSVGPGVIFKERGTGAMKAPADGVYELGAGRYKVKKGGDIPEGGTFKSPEEDAASTYHATASAGYQETPGKSRPGATPRFGELDGERVADALRAAGYWVVKEADMVPGDPPADEGLIDLTDEQKAQKAKAEQEAAAKTGPSETTQGTGPSETPEAGGPITTTSATTKKKDT